MLGSVGGDGYALAELKERLYAVSASGVGSKVDVEHFSSASRELNNCRSTLYR